MLGYSRNISNTFTTTLPPSVKSQKNDWQFATKGQKKEKTNNEQPTHKTAHLQTPQVDAQPKFAKELFSCRRTHWVKYLWVF